MTAVLALLACCVPMPLQGAPGGQAEPAKITVPGEKLSPPPIKLACETAKTLSFDAVATYDPFELPGSHATSHPFSVAFKRPRLFRIERPGVVERFPTGPTSFEASGDNVDLFVMDGEVQFSYSTKRNMYWKSPASKDLVRMRYDTDLHVFLILEEGLWGYRREGTADVNGRKVDVYATQWSLPGKPGGAREVLYVDPKTRLPVRYVRSDVTPGQNPKERMRTDYSNWKVNPKLDNSYFRFAPPVGARQGKQ